MGKKRKGLYLHDVGPQIQMRIKLLAIAEGKHMYKLCEELLAEALEARRLKYERGEKTEEKEGD